MNATKREKVDVESLTRQLETGRTKATLELQASENYRVHSLVPLTYEVSHIYLDGIKIAHNTSNSVHAPVNIHGPVVHNSTGPVKKDASRAKLVSTHL